MLSDVSPQLDMAELVLNRAASIDMTTPPDCPPGFDGVLQKVLWPQPEDGVIEQHLACHDAIWLLMGPECTGTGYIEAQVIACKRQIELAPEAARAFKPLMGSCGLPEHWGYMRLAALHEKCEEYEEAMRLLREAQVQGWRGSWEDDIERVEMLTIGRELDREIKARMRPKNSLTDREQMALSVYRRRSGSRAAKK